MAALPQQTLSFSDVFEDDDVDSKLPPTVHHIRANSSIMQVKKILGECRIGSPCLGQSTILLLSINWRMDIG